MVLSGLILSVSNGAAVSARRPEIGLRRVFGARPKDLHAQVVLESCIVGLSAGLVGTSLGMPGTVVPALGGGGRGNPLCLLVGPLAGCGGLWRVLFRPAVRREWNREQR